MYSNQLLIIKRAAKDVKEYMFVGMASVIDIMTV